MTAELSLRAQAENWAEVFTDAVSNGNMGEAKDVVDEITEVLDDLPLSQANLLREHFLTALHRDLSVAHAQEQEMLAKPRQRKKS